MILLIYFYLTWCSVNFWHLISSSETWETHCYINKKTWSNDLDVELIISVFRHNSCNFSLYIFMHFIYYHNWHLSNLRAWFLIIPGGNHCLPYLGGWWAVWGGSIILSWAISSWVSWFVGIINFSFMILNLPVLFFYRGLFNSPDNRGCPLLLLRSWVQSSLWSFALNGMISFFSLERPISHVSNDSMSSLSGN